MADGTVAATDVVLRDCFPDGPSLPHIPTSGFTGSDQNNVSALPRGLKLGTKVKYYDETAGGPVTMIYLGLADQDTVTVAVGHVLRPAGGTDNSDENIYMMGNDPDDQMFADTVGPAAIAISAITDAYYGWFWCGGHCPQDGKAFCSVLAAASIPTNLSAGHSNASAVCAGDDSTADMFALVEPASYLGDIFGHITAVAGGTAT